MADTFPHRFIRFPIDEETEKQTTPAPSPLSGAGAVFHAGAFPPCPHPVAVRTARAPWYGAAALPQVRVTGRRALRGPGAPAGDGAHGDAPGKTLSVCYRHYTRVVRTRNSPAHYPAARWGHRALPPLRTHGAHAHYPGTLYPNAVESPKSSAAGDMRKAAFCVGRFHGKKNNRVVLKYGILRVP